MKTEKLKKYAKSLIGIILAFAVIVPLLTYRGFAASPTLNRTSFSIAEGKTYTLKTSGYSGKITWSSSDKKTASVSDKGKVTAKSAGTATISAKCGKTTLKCKVIVLTNKINPAASSVTVEAGMKKTVKFNISDSIKDIVCSSADKTIATAAFDRKTNTLSVTGVKAGKVKIKVYSKSNKKLYRNVSVTVIAANAKPDSEPEEIADIGAFAAEVLRLTNIERVNNGLSALSGDNDSLNAAAMQRAEEIITLFSHTRPDGSSCFSILDEYGVQHWGAAENIAAGYASPADVVNGWMNSPGHRSNILNSNMSYMGVGVGADGNGRLHWVQLFTG